MNLNCILKKAFDILISFSLSSIYSQIKTSEGDFKAFKTILKDKRRQFVEPLKFYEVLNKA